MMARRADAAASISDVDIAPPHGNRKTKFVLDLVPAISDAPNWAQLIGPRLIADESIVRPPPPPAEIVVIRNRDLVAAAVDDAPFLLTDEFAGMHEIELFRLLDAICVMGERLRRDAHLGQRRATGSVEGDGGERACDQAEKFRQQHGEIHL